MPTPFGLTTPIQVVNPSSNLDSLYGPYPDISAALAATQNLRQPGKTVGIITGAVYDGDYITGGTVEEYWFKEGIDDSDLIPKVLEGESTNLQSVLDAGSFGSVTSNIIIQKLATTGGQLDSELTLTSGTAALITGEGSLYVTDTLSTFSTPVQGSDAVEDNQFVTLGQLNSSSTGQTLQTVTDNGNTTTNSIYIQDGSGNSKIEFATDPDVGNIDVKDPNGTAITSISPVQIITSSLALKSDLPAVSGILSSNNLTASRSYQLPDQSGTIPLTVNGISADAEGNINTISEATTSHKFRATGGETAITITDLIGRNVTGVWRIYPFEVIISGTPTSDQVLFNITTGQLTFLNSLNTNEFIYVLSTSSEPYIDTPTYLTKIVDTYAEMVAQLSLDDSTKIVKYIVRADEENGDGGEREYTHYNNILNYIVIVQANI